MKKIIILNFFFSILFCKVLHIGNGQQYSSLSSAAAVALPGDTLLFHSGTYSGGGYIQNLKGTESNWITILAYENQSVIVQGGSTAWQFSDPEYLKIQGFIFENQTSNGVNIDDGGTFETPAENIVISDCIFRNINASGNNDLLKLSGVDNFEIKNCRFENGSPGGSGADMVGCHNGIFSQNHFENAGINAIQSKGGSQYITIERNFFKNCGDRTLNLGGSTSLQYFRPLNAEFEAADINVFSNIFISSEAPIAYVGSVRVNVVNNTFYLPEKWVVRILQETVDPDRFAECGDNKFANNIIYLGNISTETNIGPNTRPSTFLYENNFWYNYQNTSWSGPDIPVIDSNQTLNLDPQFTNIGENDFSIQSNSPASARISGYSLPENDFYGNRFNNPRSAGAIEGNEVTSVKTINGSISSYKLEQNYPNPFNPSTMINYQLSMNSNVTLKIYDILGREVITLVNEQKPAGTYTVEWNGTNTAGQKIGSGIYFYQLKTGSGFMETKKMMLLR